MEPQPPTRESPAPMEEEPRRFGAVRIVLAALVLVAVASMAFGFSYQTWDVHGTPLPSLESSHVSAAATVAATPDASTAQALQLGISATPSRICAYGLDTCSAGSGTARVTLSANAGNGGVLAWPAVQVAFVIETTLYDGVYDPSAQDSGSDPCAESTQIACEESNGVPFFVKNAQLIASEIQSANPHSRVSFALVDYFATLTDHDDGDGSEYHVDIQDFVPAAQFGSAVSSTFQAQVLEGGYVYEDSDFSDNILDSSSITALYGTIIGSGLTWSNDTHHVIVWMGSTAPRDPSYTVNYYVSASDDYDETPYDSQSCEPSYAFAIGASPDCEGWIHSQDGNASHSIAALAQTAPSCTDSIGGVCTVDTIDLWTTTTDPYSRGWPSGRAGGGAGGTIVIQDVDKIIAAGCDLAAATGGSWDGPAGYVCPNGDAGTLQYVPHGPALTPDTNNPTLLEALRGISFGPVLQTQVAAGTGNPLFTYVPIGNIKLPDTAAQIDATASCDRNGEPFRTCQTNATIEHAANGLIYLGWNWSTNRSSNIMYVGDSWTASFNVIADGPPFATVPVDACVTQDCRAGGSEAVEGYYTAATYVPYSNNTVDTESFPLGTVTVEVTPPVPLPPTAPPPPPPAPPPFAIPAPTPLPVIQQIGIGNSVGIANVSLQGVAAGFLGAGFIRVSIKNRPIANPVLASKQAAVRSKFEGGAVETTTSVGRFE